MFKAEPVAELAAASEATGARANEPRGRAVGLGLSWEGRLSDGYSVT